MLTRDGDIVKRVCLQAREALHQVGGGKLFGRAGGAVDRLDAEDVLQHRGARWCACSACRCAEASVGASRGRNWYTLRRHIGCGRSEGHVGAAASLRSWRHGPGPPFPALQGGSRSAARQPLPGAPWGAQLPPHLDEAVGGEGGGGGLPRRAARVARLGQNGVAGKHLVQPGPRDHVALQAAAGAAHAGPRRQQGRNDGPNIPASKQQAYLQSIPTGLQEPHRGCNSTRARSPAPAEPTAARGTRAPLCGAAPLTWVMNTSRPGPTGLGPSGLHGGFSCRAKFTVGLCSSSGYTLEVTTFQPPLVRVTLSMVVLTPAAAGQGWGPPGRAGIGVRKIIQGRRAKCRLNLWAMCPRSRPPFPLAAAPPHVAAWPAGQPGRRPWWRDQRWAPSRWR